MIHTSREKHLPEIVTGGNRKKKVSCSPLTTCAVLLFTSSSSSSSSCSHQTRLRTNSFCSPSFFIRDRYSDWQYQQCSYSHIFCSRIILQRHPLKSLIYAPLRLDLTRPSFTICRRSLVLKLPSSGGAVGHWSDEGGSMLAGQIPHTIPLIVNL